MSSRRAPLLRLVLFLVGAAASLAFAIAAGSAAIGVARRRRPLAGMALISALASAAMLLVTAGLLRVEGAISRARSALWIGGGSASWPPASS